LTVFAGDPHGAGNGKTAAATTKPTRTAADPDALNSGASIKPAGPLVMFR
jgi:hypothetical protein